MKSIDIGTRREVCWDEELIDRAELVKIKMHKPEYRGIAMTCDRPWEGCSSGYFSVTKDNDLIRLYYRGSDAGLDSDGHYVADRRDMRNWLGLFCYAESLDGKTFTRPDLGLVNRQGSTHNNILLDKALDNLCIFRDNNPSCKPDELFKGLAGEEGQKLVYYKSADGVHFEGVGVLLSDGAYDSLNLAFWDSEREQYFVYYRGVHRKNELDSDGKWHDGYEGNGIVRDVRVRTSKDFIHWDEPHLIAFEEGKEDYQLYTNQVMPYYRAPHLFLGMPTRYVERLEDRQNFKYLPAYKLRSNLSRLEGRTGYAVTDCVLMTTRDGTHFRRTDEAFLTPGIENGSNWFYGNCYPAWGMIETESDRPGFPPEISIYSPECYWAKRVELARYAIRIDGFFSWNSGYAPGHVLTKPITFEGAELEINFATSALGYLRIVICDEAGDPIKGFDSGRLFGDSLDRLVDFEGSLKTLAGKPVRLLLELSDADLYSFRFNSENIL